MTGKGVRDLPGLTAREILETHFKNELDEGTETETVVRASEYLDGLDFEVWEFRGVSRYGTVWRDALEKFWVVDHETGDIAESPEQ